MAKFRKKPVVVEAEQWPGDGSSAWPPGLDDRNSCLRAGRECQVNGPHAHGKQGPVAVKPTDWLIKEPDGSGYYPCAADIFAATYEPAEPASIPTFAVVEGAPCGRETAATLTDLQGLPPHD